MPDDFDPYHVWLGIPPDEQPANRYRLLGIRAFESNPDVIDNAADRQTVHLRTFQGGKHGVLTQRLLNEVAAARICLLNPQTKAAYDQQLRAALAAVTPQSPVASPFGPPTARAPGGSQIGRAQPANLPVARPIETPAPQAAPPPQAGNNWDDLIGAHETTTRKPTGKSAKTAARRQASNRLIYGIVGGVLVVAVGVAAVLYLINANADAALIFDWPDADRAGATLAIDGEPVQIPASGSWEFHCPPGDHRIVAQRPAFKLDQQVAVSAGDRHAVVPDWKPKALLLVNWPLAERSGAALTVDGRPTKISAREVIELPVEPGSHVVRIARPDAEPLEATVSVASDRRQSVSLQASKPATLVIDWPADERESAKLIIDNKEQPLDSPQLEFTLNPGRHTVRLIREGFESVNQIVNAGAAGLKPMTPVWVRRDATAATGGPIPTEPMPSTDVPEPPGSAADNVAKKRLPVPSDAEQKRITKQLDETYQIEPLPEKQRALAEQLFALTDQPGTSPDERYMLLMKAIGLAAKVWDLNSALHGIDLLDAAYQVDSFEIKQQLIDDAVRLADSPEHAAAVLMAAEQIIEQAVAEERYDNALAMADAANKALGKLPAESRARKDAADRLARRRREIVVLQTASATAVEAEAALDKTPDDPEASSTLGRWYCLYKGDWDRGLPLLAKGKEGSLKSLAQQELAVNLELKPQLELADGWWDVALKETGLPRDLVRLHAGEIYQLMLPNLQPGIKKTAVEKRLMEIQPIVEERLSQNAARRGAWDQFDLTHATVEDGFVRLTKDENLIITKNDYSGPLDISLIARTAANNIRIYGPRGSSVIFNWEANPAELRMTRPDGNDGPETGSLATATVQPLSPHRWYPLRWRIANDGMEIWIAGKAVFTEKRSYDLSANTHVAVRAVDSNVDIKSFSISPVKKDAGTKSALEARPSAPVQFPRGHWVDVLRLVDTTKNVVKGNWSRNGSDVSCEPGDCSRVAVPVVVNGSYDLELEFTRTGGDADVDTIFTIGGRQSSVLLSMDHGGVSGLDRVDGKRPWDKGNPAIVRPGALVNGQRYRLLVNVRLPQPDHASIDVSLDGKPYLPHWEGNPASLSLDPGWHLPDIRELGLAVWNTRVTFHSMRLKVVAGRAIAETAAVGNKSEVDSPSGSSGKKKQIDLLKLVDLKRDAINGKWQVKDGQLLSAAEEYSKLQFPYEPPQEYDFEVAFTRTSGHDCITQICTGEGREFDWTVSGWGGGLSAINAINGKAIEENPTRRELSITSDRRYTSVVKVRRDRIETWLDGKLIVEWKTDYRDIEMYNLAWRLPNQARLGIGCFESSVTFHSAKLTEITGTGKVLVQPSADSPAKPATGVKPAAGSPSVFPRGQWVDLLRLVDSKTDAVRGTWSHERGEISCNPEEFSRIKLPVIINGGYDLEIEFTRTESNSDVCVVLPVGARECSVILSAEKGDVSGLEFVDGHDVHDRQNSFVVRPGTLENDHRYRLLARVRLLTDGTASVDVSLQGKPYLPHWQGNPSSLSSFSGWKLPNAGQPGIGAWKSGVTFHSARLRMVTGEATAESE